MRYPQNLVASLILGFGVYILCVFGAALIDSRPGEVAGALGSVVGGVIGALGAAFAVYLTLRSQRQDEAEKISTGIVMEVAQLAKFPLEQLATCRLIYAGGMSPPRDQLSTLMQTPKPVIYPANAEHIGRVHRPALVVAFYTGLAETQATVNVITQAPTAALGPADVMGLGIILREQCILARQILATSPPLHGTDQDLMTKMIIALVRMLDEEIQQSKKVFPSTQEYQEMTRVPAN